MAALMTVLGPADLIHFASCLVERTSAGRHPTPSSSTHGRCDWTTRQHDFRPTQPTRRNQ